ncbi:ABC transporter permease [Gemmatimonadota bacterium]
MKRALLVAAHELTITIRRPAYLLTIFGMPILFGAIFGIIGLVTAKSVMRIRPRVFAVVDSSGVLDHSTLRGLEEDARERGVLNEEEAQALTDRMAQVQPSTLELVSETFSGFNGTVNLVIMADADSAREVTRRGELNGALIIAEDYLSSGRVWGYNQTKTFIEDDEGEGPAERLLRRALLLSLLNRQEVDPAIENRILYPMNLQAYEVSATSEEFEETGVISEIRKFALPYAFSLLLLMSIMMGGGYLLQGVAEEKENRVMELLLSSVTTDELMFGKVLGLGACGLIQILVWLGIGFGGLTLLASNNVLPGFEVPVDLFLLCFGYFLVGYMMIASLMAGAGSLGNTMKESQQLSMWFTMPIVAPMILMMAILAEPVGTIARIFSWFPLTSPVTMMLRLPSGQVPWWEIPLTFGILILSTWFALKFGAKLFRLGSLMYGKRPTLPEIFRWMRQA